MLHSTSMPIRVTHSLGGLCFPPWLDTHQVETGLKICNKIIFVVFVPDWELRYISFVETNRRTFAVVEQVP